MICPVCKFDNPNDANFCVDCGSALTPPEAPASSAHRTNQVWNTEIEQEANRKNSRTAMAVLGVMIALVIALTVGMLINLPSIGDGLIGERGDGQSFTDRFADFWAFFTDTIAPEPEPDYGGRVEYTLEMSDIKGTADDEFLTDFPALLAFTYDYCYDDIHAVTQERRLLERYRNAEFADPQLQALALDYLYALDDRAAALAEDEYGELYIDDSYAWNIAYGNQCLAVSQLQEYYSIFSQDDLHIPIFTAAYGMYDIERFYWEQNFLDALTGINAQWDSRKKAYTVTLTNTSEYTAEVIVYNEYETEDDWMYEEDELVIGPNETVTIVLDEMPDDYENRYVDVYVYELYTDEDYTLYDYYWDYYYEQFTK